MNLTPSKVLTQAFATTLLFLGSTAMAWNATSELNEEFRPQSTIRCKGRTEDIEFTVKLGVSFLALSDAEYKHRKNKVSMVGFEFGIHTEKTEGTQKLLYRFKTQKRHKFAKKGATMEFSIFQYSPAVTGQIDGREFYLSDAHEARLRLEKENGQFEVVDTFDCVAE